MFKKIKTPYGGELEEIMTTPDVPIDQTETEIYRRKHEAHQELQRRLDEPVNRIRIKETKKKTSFFESLKKEWKETLETIANEINQNKE